jgi:hypothetical protein
MATKKTRNPNAKNLDDTTKKIDRLANKYRAVFTREVAAGVDPRTAARRAYAVTSWEDETSDIIAGGISKSVTVAGGVSFSRKTYLDQVFDGVKLSRTIVDSGKSGSAAVGEVIRQNLANGAAWNKLSRDIAKTDLLSGTPTARLDDLATAARRAWSGNDPVALRKYERELASFKKYSNRLLDESSDLGGLRRAYKKVIVATQKGSEAALQKAIDNAVKKKMAYNAQRIARTEMQRAWGAQTIKEFRDDPDIGGVLWVTSLDERLCEICEGVAQEDIGYGPGVYPFDKMPEYPVHPNCVVGDSEVNFNNSILAAYKSVYRGDIVKISTANGREIAVTPNHPILTTIGFINAAQIAANMHELVCTRLYDERVCNPVDKHDNNGKATAEEVFNSLVESGIMTAVSVPTSTEYLHGDGKFIDKKIDVIYSERLLRCAKKPYFFETIAKSVFGGGNSFRRCLIALCSFVKLIIWPRLSPNSVMRGLCVSAVFLARALRHHDAVSIDNATARDPHFYEPSADNLSRDPERVRNSLLAISAGVPSRYGVIVKAKEILSENPIFKWFCRFFTKCYFCAFRAGPNVNICRSYDSLDRGITNSKHSGYTGNRGPGLIEFDNVVAVEIDTSAHDSPIFVYDFSVLHDEIYISNGVIVHNCRCNLQPKTIDEFKK